MNRRLLVALALVAMLALAGCGEEREEGEPVENDTVVENYEVITVDGETYVCFSQADNGATGEQMECLPHNGSATADNSSDRF